MTIFESIAGRNDHITFIAGKEPVPLFLVEDEQIRPMWPSYSYVTQVPRAYGSTSRTAIGQHGLPPMPR
jgi:hypothetical protein